MAYSSGAPPAELLARDGARGSGGLDGAKQGELDQDLTALSYVPRVSLSNDHVAVQRTQDFEIGYERVDGSRTYTAGVYHEVVSNAAFMLSSPDASLPAGNLMPDLNSNSVILNVGSYQRTGFDAGVKQMLGDHAEVALAAGMTGALTAARGGDVSETIAGLTSKQVPWVTIRAATLVPITGTRITVDYGWTDPGTLMPAHLSLRKESIRTSARIFISASRCPPFCRGAWSSPRSFVTCSRRAICRWVPRTACSPRRRERCGVG